MLNLAASELDSCLTQGVNKSFTVNTYGTGFDL